MGRKKLEPLLNPIEKAKLQRPTYSERYEEELKASLFKDDDTEEVDDAIYDTENWAHHKRPNEEWDVPIDEKIEYFDPELSYELTGYRPITMEQGLDFNPDDFRECAITYNKENLYSKFPKGSKPYRDFWKMQLDRCTNGYTVGKYRITGDHYFFLNFYRMQTVVEGAVAGTGRNESFPGFLSKQYEFLHYCEMAEKLGKDICILKARGLGLSELVANMSVRPYTTNKGYKVLLTCAADQKLKPLKEKCWKQLDWLNENTNGGFRHVRQKINNNDSKRASKVTKEGIEYGWMSQIDAVVADTSDKVRGERNDRIIYEEAGSNPQLIKSWIQGAALVELGGIHFGTRIALGTGGDVNNLEGLSKMFKNPDAYNILKYKNYDTDDGKEELSAFFIPAHKFALSKEYLDNRGVTDHIRFKKHYETVRKTLTDQDLIIEMAEHCFNPREALSNTSSCMFNSVFLSERLVQLKTNKNEPKPIHTQLLWEGDKHDKVTGHEDKNSKLLVLEPPVVDEFGKPYKNLYVAGIDAIDQGTKDSASNTDVSDFCIVIMKRIFGQDGKKIVAIYKDRPRDIREAYDLTMKLLTWYNCQAMLEYTKISIIQYFTDRKKQHLFMERPELAGGSQKNRRSAGKRLVGVPGTTGWISHGLELIQSFVEEFWEDLGFEEVIMQLLHYTYEDKRKFDIVAALAMALIGDSSITNVNVSASEKINQEWKDIGYYKDENGRIKYGVIPKQNNRIAKWHT